MHEMTKASGKLKKPSAERWRQWREAAVYEGEIIVYGRIEKNLQGEWVAQAKKYIGGPFRTKIEAMEWVERQCQ